MWHLAACKISVSLLFLKWNDFLSYLWLTVAWIQGYDKKSFHFDPVKNERLTEIIQAVRCHILTFYDCINTVYQFIKPFLGNKMLFFFFF